jgi:hypothetical protein
MAQFPSKVMAPLLTFILESHREPPGREREKAAFSQNLQFKIT